MILMVGFFETWILLFGCQIDCMLFWTCGLLFFLGITSFECMFSFFSNVIFSLFFFSVVGHER